MKHANNIQKLISIYIRFLSKITEKKNYMIILDIVKRFVGFLPNIEILHYIVSVYLYLCIFYRYFETLLTALCGPNELKLAN